MEITLYESWFLVSRWCLLQRSLRLAWVSFSYGSDLELDACDSFNGQRLSPWKRKKKSRERSATITPRQPSHSGGVIGGLPRRTVSLGIASKTRAKGGYCKPQGRSVHLLEIESTSQGQETGRAGK